MGDYKEAAKDRRDIRNAKDPEPETGSVKISVAKKDKKKFCGGKVGREHELECVRYNDAKPPADFLKKPYEGVRLLICKKCGKELAIYMPRWSKKDKPDWVDK